MGYVSILVGFFLVLFLICKKWPAIIVGIIATCAIILLNWLNFGETFTNVYFTGFATMVQSLFPPIFAGNLVAQVYNRTGAVRSISDTMAHALFKESASKTRTYISCILAIVIPTGILAYCGMNGLVTLIAFYPIALGLMERANIPKRYVMGMLSFGVYAFAMTGPGTAQIVNVLANEVAGQGPTAGLVGGLVGIVAELVFGTLVLTLMIKRDVAKGLKFAYGPKDIQIADDKKLPNFVVSLIPLLSVVVFFNVIKLDIFSSCLAAWILSILLLGKYMPKKEGSLLKELFDVCAVSGSNAFGPCGMVGSLFGFVSVVQTLPEFQTILNYIFSLNVAPLFVLILSINIVGALTGSSSSAIRIGMPMAMQH